MLRLFMKGVLTVFLCVLDRQCDGQGGYDTGMDAATAAAQLVIPASPAVHTGLFLRIRGVVDPVSSGTVDVTHERAALAALRRQGFRICVLLTASPGRWRGGTRYFPGHQIPIDLREAYNWVARLSAAYSGLVDLWEIDNESDLGFVPENAETYVAYLKACRLGAERSASRSPCVVHSLVLMSSLGLPPGPYLEREIDNGLLSYTSGFNYHYYGYAQDFTGVYQQFERAVDDLFPLTKGPSKMLPVFLTECGDGMLGAREAGTVEGRMSQWRWFKKVDEQIRALRIGGPMMFVLRPYLERNLNEFGLEMPVSPRLVFTSKNFGETVTAPWTRGIGQPYGDGIASPALAYLGFEDKERRYTPQSWHIRAPTPSPIVIDFLGGRLMKVMKSYQGYSLLEEHIEADFGTGELRVYNFSNYVIAGHLELGGSVSVSLESNWESEIELKPQELRIFPARLAVSRKSWRGHPWSVTFVPNDSAVSASRFSTILYPDWGNARKTVLMTFNFAASQAGNSRTALLARPLADDEPQMELNGRWLVTNGIHVREETNIWEFDIDDLPRRSLRPAIAELPLPDNFVVPENSFLRLALRCKSAGPTTARYAGLSAAKGGIMQVQFRTANGNLYEVWPRRSLLDEWQAYEECEGNFTMSFYGRANLPWRFRDNHPVSLVFSFWPRTLPVTIQVKPIGIIGLE
jgi:hypothetical protein